MIERRSNRRARNGRKTPKNVLFVFQNCTFRFADYIFHIQNLYLCKYTQTSDIKQTNKLWQATRKTEYVINKKLLEII